VHNFHSIYAADNQSRAYLVGRRVSAAFGTATIPAVYLVAAEPFGPVAGLFAAAIMTVTTLHVRDSKFATTDVPPAFWLTLALAMTLRIDGARFRHYAGAGFCCGLAAATKYPAGIVVLAIVIQHVLVSHREEKRVACSLADRRFVLAGIIAVATFFCASPYVILDWRQTLTNAQKLASHPFFAASPNWPAWARQMLAGTPHVLRPVVEKLLTAGHGSLWLTLHALPDSFGIAFEILLAVSLAWCLVRPKLETLCLFSFIAFAILTLIMNRSFYRYLLVVLPAMIVIVAAIIGDIVDRHSSLAPAAFVGVLALIILPSLVRGAELNRLLERTDTRTEARHWIESHVPRGSSIG
jgi:4-amino-4-deoxy-L-arabinose transferase-like glycosyltransferase